MEAFSLTTGTVAMDLGRQNVSVVCRALQNVAHFFSRQPGSNAACPSTGALAI
jgi:hypothetical protein